MDINFSDPALYNIYQKVANRERLDLEDGLVLYRSDDLTGVGRLADIERKRRYERNTFYVYNQHLNYTNVCINRCLFCGFSRDEGEEGAYTFSLNDIDEHIRSRLHEPVREVHVVGGLNPALPFSYYVDLLGLIRDLRPDATLKAFTAVEIDFISRIAGFGIKETLRELKRAGLAMMPGGGAEVLNERIHRRLYPKKIGPERWLEVIKAAHEMGITTNATMLYGHIETLKERVMHLIALRHLQDETGGITAFIPLSFHPEKTRLSHLPPNVGVDDLKTVAVSRLMLDNVPHIKAYWVMVTPGLAQVAMSFGADDLDGTIIEEKITHMAGAKTPKGISCNNMRNLILSGGFRPVERDAFYNCGIYNP